MTAAYVGTSASWRTSARPSYALSKNLGRWLANYQSGLELIGVRIEIIS